MLIFFYVRCTYCGRKMQNTMSIAKWTILLTQFNVMIKTSMRARDHVASYVRPRSNALNSKIVIIRALLSTTYLKSCLVLAKTIK
jgi:hypothetical protein